MHIIVEICLFDHAMHKTPLLIIRLCLIFEILSRKVTSVCLREAPEEALYIVLHGKRC